MSAEEKINSSVAQTIAAVQPSPGEDTLPETLPAPTYTAAAVVEQPTLTPVPLATLAPSTTMIASPTTDSCYQAKWISDVTYPDGTKVLPSKSFTKTWRIQNVGTCSWNTSYAIVFDSGHGTGAPTATPLTAAVPPGGTIDASVIMTSPAEKGDYTWNFKLRSDTGRIFGFGNNYVYPITVVIKVDSFLLFPINPGLIDAIAFESLQYDFSENYCSATWKSIFGILDCPGDTSDSQGFVKRNDDPKLQDNTVYSGRSLFTHPPFVNNGVIRGDFPAISIEDGYHFRSTIGCSHNRLNCNVKMAVFYRVGSAAFEQLGSWDMKYADPPLKTDIDLSFLAGKSVQFGFSASTNGSAEEDWAHWVYPRIVK